MYGIYFDKPTDNSWIWVNRGRRYWLASDEAVSRFAVWIWGKPEHARRFATRAEALAAIRAERIGAYADEGAHVGRLPRAAVAAG